MKTCIAVLFIMFAAACTDEGKSREALDNLGFRDIQVGGYDAFTCGDDYTFSTHFTATNPNGKHVEGTVCCGWIKGCSVKF